MSEKSRQTSLDRVLGCMVGGAASVVASETERQKLEHELRNTPADVLDLDTVSRKNDAL